MVELKSGETYNGMLVNCDAWMNVNLKDVIVTSPTGDRFWKLPECHLRGLMVKYIRIPDDVIDFAKSENTRKRQEARRKNAGKVDGPRGGSGSRGGFAGRGGSRDGGSQKNSRGVNKK